MYWNILMAVSWMLTGLIWMVQLVHYPSFQYVAEEQFVTFHHHHTTSISIIVMPLMIMELALSIWLSYSYGWNWRYLSPLLIVLAIWACTFFISVPLHGLLEKTKDTQVIADLVRTNWPRTILWTIKSFYITWLFTKI
jgi:hypothetical protein